MINEENKSDGEIKEQFLSQNPDIEKNEFEPRWKEMKSQGSITMLGGYNRRSIQERRNSRPIEVRPIVPAMLPQNMDQEQIARIEARRQQEQGQDQVADAELTEEEIERMVLKDKDQCERFMVYNIMNLIFFGFFTYYYRHQFQLLKTLNNPAYFFIIFNFVFYVLHIFLYLYHHHTPKDKYKFNSSFTLNFNLLLVVYSFWGMYVTYHDQSYRGQCPQMYVMLNLLIYARIWWFLIIFALILLLVLLICCLCCCRGAIDLEEDQHINRIPVVKDFLKQRARKFNPNTADKEVESCVICLDNFEEGDGKEIAELNCNAKHIFHVQCLTEWVEKNDVCPMCREPIIKEQMAQIQQK